MHVSNDSDEDVDGVDDVNKDEKYDYENYNT